MFSARGADIGTAWGLTWPSRSGHLKGSLFPLSNPQKPDPVRQRPHHLALLAGKSGRTEAPCWRQSAPGRRPGPLATGVEVRGLADAPAGLAQSVEPVERGLASSGVGHRSRPFLTAPSGWRSPCVPAHGRCSHGEPGRDAPGQSRQLWRKLILISSKIATILTVILHHSSMIFRPVDGSVLPCPSTGHNSRTAGGWRNSPLCHWRGMP